MAPATRRYLRGDSYQRTPQQVEHQNLIEQVFGKHKRRYGSRRITAELQEKGHMLERHQVRMLMKTGVTSHSAQIIRAAAADRPERRIANIVEVIGRTYY